jgi:GPI-anchor transamidase subunit GAA1
MFLSALATLNFSLSFLIGLCAAPFSFIRTPNSQSSTRLSPLLLSVLGSLVLAAVNPLVLIFGATKYFNYNLTVLLMKAAEGWHVWGMWTQVVVWLVWWPAWFVAAVIVALGFW